MRDVRIRPLVTLVSADAAQRKREPQPDTAVPRSLIDYDEEVANRLVGAKHVVWRGRGELPQRPWPVRRRGLWLVLDLWAGFSTTVLALLALGVRCIVLCAECEATPTACLRRSFPNAVHVHRVQYIHAGMFTKLCARRQFEGLLIGGGAPCQGNSYQNPQRRGLEDPRHAEAHEIQRLSKDLAQFQIPTVSWLENSASAPKAVVEHYSTLMGSQPLATSAAQCGYVDRKRYFWATGPEGSLTKNTIEVPEDWLIGTSQHRGQAPRKSLEYTGVKPIPPVVHVQNGYSLEIDPRSIVEAGGKGALYPFTRNFYHPRDLEYKATPPAVARFRADNQQFPPLAYEFKSIAWHGAAKTGANRMRTSAARCTRSLMTPWPRVRRTRRAASPRSVTSAP